MTREQKFYQLESLCQEKYNVIDKCFESIKQAQKDLDRLETQYLRAKATYEKVKPTKIYQKRLSKIDKLKRQLIELGIENIDKLF